MTPAWVQEQVLAFGRLLGLKAFALDDRGRAAAQFENGVRLSLEYAASALWVQALFAYPADTEAMKRLLAAAHPSGAGLRAAYRAEAHEALLAVGLGQSDIEVTAIDAAFHTVFEGAVRLGRMS